MPETRPVRVVYADDNAPYRTQLLRTLVAEPGIDVVAVVVDGHAALEAIEQHRPDVALVDLSTPGVSGLDIAEHVASQDPPLPTRVLLLAALPVPSTRRVLQAVGLRGVVDRASSRGDICAALTAAAV
ncbi:MAG: response regulator transcription factor [Solirubrobacterales bacterium]|jgi:two-component system nitrate/nitrite response regulator NarL|nr:response regulator transcription factor [Solirubrobacterales bacterium]